MTGVETLAGVFRRGREVICSAAAVMTLVSVSMVDASADRALTGHSEQGRSAGWWMLDRAFGVRTLLEAGDVLDSTFGDTLFVTMYESNAILSVDVDGSILGQLDLAPYIANGQPFSPTLDRQHAYGGALLFVDKTRSKICAVLPGGQFHEVVLDIGAEVAIAECDPYGAFGGEMLVLDVEGTLWCVGAQGQRSALARDAGQPASDLDFVRFGSFGDARVFIADPGRARILKIGASHPVGERAEVWVDYSATKFAPVSIAISESGPFGEGVMYVADGNSGRILMLDSDGRHLGEFMSGLSMPLSIELPTVGRFAGSMVIVSGPEVLVVEPIVTSELSALQLADH